MSALADFEQAFFEETHVVSDSNWKEKLPQVRGSLRFDSDLSKNNWFQVGGKAEVFFKPADEEDLAHFMRHYPAGIPLTILGVGSNVIIRDGGLPGIVIRLGRGFADIQVEGKRISAGAAAMNANVAMLAQQNGIGGLEFLSGIPGTIGGALAMNAGAYETDASALLVEARVVDTQGKIHTLSREKMGFTYRGNAIPRDWIFIAAVLEGEPDDPLSIAKKISDIQEKRSGTQPVRSRTGGSTFKNPPGQKAWQLIDAAGCRGLKIGGAQVSELHCNFLINTGNATAWDLETLGDEVRERVKAHSGVELEWEIRRIGIHRVETEGMR